MGRIVGMLLVLTALGQADAKDVVAAPVMPVSAVLPPLPDHCVGASTLSGDGLRFITLFGRVNWEGRATEVEVQEPSDECLKEAAIEAVREWRFDPVEPEDYGWKNFHATLIYPPQGPSRFELTSHGWAKRYPPLYPKKCISKARAVEVVLVTFDVTTEGVPENVESKFSTLPCLADSAVTSVSKWRYEPRIIDGRAYPRKGIHTYTTYELDGFDPLRREVLKHLMQVAITLNRKLDPRIALEQIAVIEERFGEHLTDAEMAMFLRYRGAAKIDALDYHGALADLESSLELERNASTAARVKSTIRELRQILAGQGDSASESIVAEEEDY